MIFDIHSHIIPEIDDGAKSISESLRMLKILKDDGVDHLVATPHFYPAHDSLDVYLAERDKGFNRLLESADAAYTPKLSLGCELYYTPHMDKLSQLSRLCIRGTNYILIELPYGGLEDKVLEEIYIFCADNNLIPIFAHLERFGLFKGYKKAVDFVAKGHALAQVNTSSFFDRRLKKFALALAKRDLISFLGNDLHSPTMKPQITKTIDFLNNHYPDSIKKIEAAALTLQTELEKGNASESNTTE